MKNNVLYSFSDRKNYAVGESLFIAMFIDEWIFKSLYFSNLKLKFEIYDNINHFHNNSTLKNIEIYWKFLDEFEKNKIFVFKKFSRIQQPRSTSMQR